MRSALLLIGLSCAAACAGDPGRRPPLIAQPGAAVANAAQTLCPVMPGKLVNRRLYVDYQGTRIYVCCNPCVKAVKRDPEKYLKKLRNQ